MLQDKCHNRHFIAYKNNVCIKGQSGGLFKTRTFGYKNKSDGCRNKGFGLKQY